MNQPVNFCVWVKDIKEIDKNNIKKYSIFDWTRNSKYINGKLEKKTLCFNLETIIEKYS